MDMARVCHAACHAACTAGSVVVCAALRQRCLDLEPDITGQSARHRAAAFRLLGRLLEASGVQPRDAPGDLEHGRRWMESATSHISRAGKSPGSPRQTRSEIATRVTLANSDSRGAQDARA